MGIENLKRFGSAPTPNQLALKSPLVYLKRINRVHPAWGPILFAYQKISATVAGSLWAAAVAIANGCRISEILSIRSHQVRPNGCAWVVGAKGSNSRLIYLGLDSSEAKELYSSPLSFAVFPWDYQWVYRACKQFGFVQALPNHKHQAVTHQGRYALAKEVAGAVSDEIAGQVLGHRSKNTAEYYVHPERCKQKPRAQSTQKSYKNLEDLLQDLL